MTQNSFILSMNSGIILSNSRTITNQKGHGGLQHLQACCLPQNEDIPRGAKGGPRGTNQQRLCG